MGLTSALCYTAGCSGIIQGEHGLSCVQPNVSGAGLAGGAQRHIAPMPPGLDSKDNTCSRGTVALFADRGDLVCLWSDDNTCSKQAIKVVTCSDQSACYDMVDNARFHTRFTLVVRAKES